MQHFPAKIPRMKTALLMSLCILQAAAERSVAADQLLDSLDHNRANISSRPALAHYFRTRTNIHWHFDPTTPPKALSPDEKQIANDAANHTFTVVDIRYTFPPGTDIDWKFNPTAAPDSTKALNHEWPWQFNRMYHWPPLAHAYRATGDRKYADELTG